MEFDSIRHARWTIRRASDDLLMKIYRDYSTNPAWKDQPEILSLVKSVMTEKKLFKAGKQQFPYYPPKKKSVREHLDEVVLASNARAIHHV